MRADNFHYVADGRGNRKVFVNGNEIKHVVCADASLGMVEYIPYPPRMKKNDSGEIYRRKLHGVVTVVFEEK